MPCRKLEGKTGRRFLFVFAMMMTMLASFALTPKYVSAQDFKAQKLGIYEGEQAWVFIYKNGEKALCLESDIAAGSGENADSEEIYRDPNLAKALYYGQYGAEPWEGFAGDEAKGVVITSRVLSDFYKKTNNDHIKGVKEFKAFLETKPVPPSEITQFAKKTLKTSWDAKRKVQVTEENEIKGSEGQKISFTLPEGIKLVKKDGKVLTGKVTVTVGDVFHLEAAAGVTGTYQTGKVGKNFKYQSIVIKTPADKQDVGTLRAIEDKAAVTEFQASWLSFNEVKISKQDITNKSELPGAKMKVIDAESGEMADEWVSTNTPHVIKNLVKGRKYILNEVAAPKGFRLSEEKIEFVAGQKEHVVMFNTPEKKPNSPKTGDNNTLLMSIAGLSAAVAAVVAAVYLRKRLQK